MVEVYQHSYLIAICQSLKVVNSFIIYFVNYKSTCSDVAYRKDYIGSIFYDVHKCCLFSYLRDHAYFSLGRKKE